MDSFLQGFMIIVKAMSGAATKEVLQQAETAKRRWAFATSTSVRMAPIRSRFRSLLYPVSPIGWKYGKGCPAKQAAP
ncbi:hypothetical protein D3C80_1688470 [compost metagenome]